MANHSTPPRIRKLSAAKQRRLDQLLEQNAEGLISARDRERLEALVAEAEELMVENAKQLADFARRQTPQAPPAAVPVTVWINPELAEK